MMFSRPLADRNRSKSKVKSQTKPSRQKSPLVFKPKAKPIVDVPQSISLNDKVVLAGGQAQTVFEIIPFQQLFQETGKRVVNCKIQVKGQNVSNSFWLGDPQSQNLYQTFDTCLISTPTKMRIVGRCPQVTKTTEVVGNLELSFEGLNRTINIPIKMVCEVPQIICLTNLQNINKGYSVIRLPIKNKSTSSIIPFKNDSPIDLVFEVNLISPPKQGIQKYQIVTSKTLSCEKNSKFSIQFDIQQNIHYNGPHPQIYTIRKLMQLKLPGSKQFFTFPVEVLVYELQQIS